MSLYSNSRISCFEQCKLKFKFQYIDQIETEIEETVEGFLGTRVHEALERLYTDIKFQKIPTLKEILEFFNSEWKKNWNDAIIIVKSDYNQENFRKMGKKYLTDYYSRYYPFNQDKTIATEKKILLKLDKEGKYQLQGYIDRLACKEDGIYIIHDYKTSGTLPTKDYVDEDRQLALYSIAVKENYNDCKKILLVWHYLAFDKEIVSERTEPQIDDLKKEIIKVIGEIEKSKEFPANVSKLCDWCQFRPECPEWKHSYKIEDKPVNEYLKDDGVTLVNKYSEVYEKLKDSEFELEKLREALIKFTEKENISMVFGSDVKASVKQYSKLSFPKKNDVNKEEFFELIKKLGLWDELATVDVYELAKMINSNELHEDFLRLLDKFIERYAIYRISLRKK